MIKLNQVVKRGLKICLYSGIFVEIVYFLATFTLLNNQSVFKLLKLNNPDLTIQVHGGWSLFPGTVHLGEINVRGEDPNVIWTVDLPSAKANIRLFDLVHKKLQFDDLLGSDVKFKLTMKSDAEKKKWIPDGKFSSLDEKIKSHWKLNFDKVTLLNASHLQIQDLVYRGKAHIHGTFFLWPGIEVEVGPAFLRLEGGSVYANSSETQAAPLVESIHGSFETKINRFRPDDVAGNDVFHYVNINAQLEAKIENFRAMNYYFRKTPQIRFDGGKGTLSATLGVSKGLLQPKSEFKLVSENLQLRAFRLLTLGQGMITGKVSNPQGVPTSDTEIAFNKFQVIHALGKQVILKGQKLSISTKTKDLDLANPFTNIALMLDLPKGEVPDLSQWPNFFLSPSKISLNQGSGEMSVSLSARSGKAGLLPTEDTKRDGHIRFSFSDLKGKWKEAEFSGRLVGNFNVAQMDLDRSKIDVPSGHFGLYQANFDFKGNKTEVDHKDWWMIGQLSALSSTIEPKMSLKGSVQIDLKNSSPLLHLYKETNDLSGLKFSILSVTEPKIYTDFAVSEKEMSFRNIKFDSHSIAALGHLTILDSGTWGSLKLKYGILSAGILLKGKETQFSLFP